MTTRDAARDGRATLERPDGSRLAASERVDRRVEAATRQFARESRARSWWHLVSTFTVLAAVLTGAALAPWWPLRLAASVIGTLTMVRAFALVHDFMHGAILRRSRLARSVLYAYAILILTPPRSWRASHNAHHADVGKIAGSEVGSFPLMTTDTWRRASPRERLAYRVARHPATILFAYLTIFFFSVCLLPLLQRPLRNWDSALSLLAHGAAMTALWHFGGFDVALFVLLLPMTIASVLGGYLFYVQHNFAGMRVLPVREWTRHRAALVSAGHLRLSPPMRWFTGNIGFHHIHHLNPHIPFYRLPQAMAAIPELQHPTVTTLRPRDVVACFRANLWDEARGRMVRYRDVPLAP